MAYSYSAIKDYKNCARKYYEVRVLKKWPRTETQATIYGEAVHKALEDYVGASKPLGAHSRFQPIADAVAAIPGKKLTEFKMALDDNLEPCDFFSPNVFIRGIADFVAIDHDTKRAYVADYKTGSAKYPDTDQLELMALMIFRHFPEVDHVKAALLFIVHDKIVTAEYSKQTARASWVNWIGKISAIETSHDTNVWPENPSGLCGWCEVNTCPHWRDRSK